MAVENIRLTNLSASAAGTEGHPRTNVSAKRSLDRAISEAVMGETGELMRRECERAGLPFLPAAAAETSQTCARCGYWNPENRESQAVSVCKHCSFRDNADFNVGRIVSNRAYVVYFNEAATVEECPTGRPDQPAQGHGRIPLSVTEAKSRCGAARRRSQSRPGSGAQSPWQLRLRCR